MSSVLIAFTPVKERTLRLLKVYFKTIDLHFLYDTAILQLLSCKAWLVKKIIRIHKSGTYHRQGNHYRLKAQFKIRRRKREKLPVTDLPLL